MYENIACSSETVQRSPFPKPRINLRPSKKPPVDLETFRAEMREVGIEEIVDVTLAMFCEEMPERVEKLNGAIDAQDIAGVSSLAHAMKSGAGSIHANQLAGLLNRVESLGKNGDAAAAADLMPRVNSEYRAVMAYLTH